MIKLFGLTWLNSEERAEYKKLKEQKEIDDSKVIWDKDIENSEFIETQPLFDTEILEKIKEYQKPYKSLRLINNMVICVLWDGTPLTAHTGGEALMNSIKECKEEHEIIALFIPKIEMKPDENEAKAQEKEQEQVKNELDIFRGNSDFVIKGEEVFLKNVESFAIPPLVVASFIEVLEKLDNLKFGEIEEGIELAEYFDSLRMFTLKLALNPIDSSRSDLIRFVRNNDIKLTLNGNLILYRKAVLVKKENKLVDFVSKEYFKKKKNKKSPKNYIIYKNGDEFKCTKESNVATKEFQDENNEVIGNLKELYLDLPNREDNLMTDGHTRTKEIRVGQVYREDEDKVDIDSRNTCSRGLHVCSKAYSHGYVGDTPLLCIISPSKVRSIPIGEDAKMRVSEMFIASILDIDEEGNYMDEDVNIVDLDEQYHNLSIQELEDALKNKSFEVISSQDKISPVNMIDVAAIKEMLKDRVKNI
jgi:hypothetical protein